MENIKKNPLSLQLNADDFLPASNEEKQSLVIMRESVNFWKDGLRRLKKKLDKEGTLKDLRNRRHYEKPSEVKRKAKQRRH